MKEKTRQLILKQAGYNMVYVPKVVALGLNLEEAGLRMCDAERFGAANIHVKEEGNGMVARWPQFYWDLASIIEKTFPEGQWLWQPRDQEVFQKAVKLQRAGRGDEAVQLCKEHTGVPQAEMPESILVQAGLTC